MAKTKISEYSSTANSNTDINNINIAEGCAPSGINDAIRTLMAQLKDWQSGAVAQDNSFNGAVTISGATVLSSTLSVASNVTINGQGDLRLADSDSSNWVALQAPTTVANNITWTLPNADGTANQVLKTDGSGNLGWTSSTSLATPLAVTGNSTAGAELRLPEDTDNGTNYVAVKAPDSLSANYTCTLPDETCTLGFRNVPQNSQSAAYTLVLSDSGKHILHPSADTTARTFTIPANSSVAFPIGTAVTFVNQNGAGSVTIAITTDTMRLAGVGTTGSRTLAANGVATAIKITSTEWIISGTGLS